MYSIARNELLVNISGILLPFTKTKPAILNHYVHAQWHIAIILLNYLNTPITEISNLPLNITS